MVLIMQQTVTQEEMLTAAKTIEQELIRSIVAMTLAAQEGRKFLTLGELDKMPDCLLEVEKASRNARTILAGLNKHEQRRR